MFNRSNRRGFTLPEVLVTVAIVAVLAAMVVPAVTQQVSKADTPTFEASLGSLRTAITSFVADVRKFPGKIDDLQVKPTASTDYTLSADGEGSGAGTGSPQGVAFTTTVANRWNGPYDNSNNTTGAITLGMDWYTANTLYDSSSYVVVVITRGATVTKQSDAIELDVAIDGSNSPTTGKVRWTAGAGTDLNPADKVRIFLMSSAQ